MKRLKIFGIIGVILVGILLVTCKKNDPQPVVPPAQQPPPVNNIQNPPPPPQGLNALETMIVGKWYMRQTILYFHSVAQSNPPNTNDPYNYIQFNTDLWASGQAAWPGVKTGISAAGGGAALQMYWTADNNRIYWGKGYAHFRVNLVTSDSLIISYQYSADSTQYFQYRMHK